MKRIFGWRNITPFTTMLATARVTSKVVLQHGIGGAVLQVATTGRRHRVHIDDRRAAVELLPERLEVRIARPTPVMVVRENPDGIDVQRVIGVLDFAQGAVDVWQRDAAHQSEPGGVLLHQLRAEVVPGPDGRPPFLRAVVEQVSVLRHRQDGHGDVELVHRVERGLRRPTPIVETAGRDEVVVNVDGAAADIELDGALLRDRKLA
jgi:hypothetical protein